jgi:SAM-dependent methyltransferase
VTSGARRAEGMIRMMETNTPGPSATPGVALARGNSTATSLNVRYRVDRIAEYISGRWLDYGCADGGYALELIRRGATEVIGLDVEEDRVRAAQGAQYPGTAFCAFDGKTIPFDDAEFDGAFVNEVLEHVGDEASALREISRVLKPGGYLVAISPNRWFPVDGHTLYLGSKRLSPAPLVPWLPTRLTRKRMDAANYWPRQLIQHVRDAGFAILDTGFIWPVLETYSWLPARITQAYQRHVSQLDDVPVLRRFGVSTLVVGVKPTAVKPA